LLSVLGQYASRFSLRALDLTMDSSMLWVGTGLAVLAAALLAFVPRLPSSGATQGLGLAAASTRMTGGTNRKLKAFALVQIAACFVLVAASAATVKTLLSLESVRARFETRHVLAVNVPVMRDGRSPAEIVAYYQEAMRQIRQQPGVVNVALGSSVPWRDKDIFKLQFSADGRVPAPDEKPPIAIGEVISPGFFSTLGLPILAGRDFDDSDRADSEPVALVSQSLSDQMFPNGNAIGHHVLWTDPVLKFIPSGVKIVPLRIVGIVPDIDNQDFVPRPTVRIYQVMTQDPILLGERLLVDVSSDPYAQVQPITKIMRKLYANQPVERARTIEDIRTEVLSPERLNAVISAVFAVVSLLIAIVGVAGVLAFSVSARTREFGIRLAVGSHPRDILMRVLAEGTAMAVGGLLVGLICGFGLGKIAGALMGDLKMPGIAPLAGSALILLVAAVTASAMPAIRAARVDVIQALRSE
jgi:predicted permease